jgi:hypothetical protein
MKWTSEQDNRIAELLRAKKTASEIGAELGRSRNAVIGRVDRCAMLKEIGFARAPGDTTGIRYKKSIAASSGDRRKAMRGGIISKNRLKPLPNPVIAKPVLVPPQTAGVSLMDLGHRQCRFCINSLEKGSNAHLFCGEVTEPGKSWCAWHEQIVWGRGTAGETATVKSAERIAA